MLKTNNLIIVEIILFELIRYDEFVYELIKSRFTNLVLLKYIYAYIFYYYEINYLC